MHHQQDPAAGVGAGDVLFLVMQTIGQRLKQARETKRLTLDEVFEGTRIRLLYLKALEEDDLSAMPSPVQARGYLRNYAEFLGLDFDRMLDEMRGQAQIQPSDEMITPMDVSSPIESTPLEVPSVAEEPPLSRPKTVRRKKADSQPSAKAASQAGLAPNTAPKRRSRKSIDPEPLQELHSEPDVVEEPAESQPLESSTSEQPNQHDANETVWQTWLNRLSSIASISARFDTQAQEPNASASEQSVEPVLPAINGEQPADTLEPGQQPTSKYIFIEIGAELRRQREFLSLHLDEVERNTHVKAHYLTALEEGAMDDLPSTVQTRGMLSNYATFLDLDVDSILLRYADALQARHRERNPQKTARAAGEPIISRIPPIRSFIAGDIVFGFGVAILLIGFTIWGVSRVMTIISEEDVQPTAPSISDVLLATTDPSLFTPTATLAPVEGGLFVPTVTIVIPTQNLNVNVQVNLIALERTYMRVVVDGEEVFNGRVVTGNAYPFEAETQVEVLVGSGAAIRVVHNGRDLGLMGDFGQVVNTIYLEEEVTTPTALPTPSPTITLTPTATVPATSTPVPSRTAVPTRTP